MCVNYFFCVIVFTPRLSIGIWTAMQFTFKGGGALLMVADIIISFKKSNHKLFSVTYHLILAHLYVSPVCVCWNFSHKMLKLLDWKIIFALLSLCMLVSVRLIINKPQKMYIYKCNPIVSVCVKIVFEHVFEHLN